MSSAGIFYFFNWKENVSLVVLWSEISACTLIYKNITLFSLLIFNFLLTENSQNIFFCLSTTSYTNLWKLKTKWDLCETCPWVVNGFIEVKYFSNKPVIWELKKWFAWKHPRRIKSINSAIWIRGRMILSSWIDLFQLRSTINFALYILRKG